MRFLKITAKVLIALLVLFTIPNYYSVIYKFGKSHKFEGNQFYNPYANINGKWTKANLHSHSKAYAGISNGKNSAEEMLHKYDSLKYDLACISNYNFVQDSVVGYHYLPAYEHGFNLKWVHQLVINDMNPKPFDYPILQLRSNKQFIINHLKTPGDLISLNHPSNKNAYTDSDLKYLNNYDLFEGISVFAKSIRKWDTALSNGHAVWIVGDDDAHDASDDHVGVCWNMINVDSLNNKSIIGSLKRGATYATKGWLGKEMNRVKSVSVENDFYKLKLNKKSDSIIVISDGGKIVATATDVDSILYQIKPENSYIRAEVFDTESWNKYTKMYINPVIRSKDGLLHQHNNKNQLSLFYSILYWLILLVVHLLLIRIIWKW